MKLQRFMPRLFHSRLFLVLALFAALLWIALTFFRRPDPVASRGPQTANVAAATNDPSRKLEGDAGRSYLGQTDQGQSLMKAIEIQQYGLKRQEHSPFDKASGTGYVGISHDENLNVWFGDDGATIRPTRAQKDRDQLWRLNLRLKAYGYGNKLNSAPPIVSRNVNENRIEYVRTNDRSAIDKRPSTITEWYINKSAGIEQGFTLNQRPAQRGQNEANDPLRLIVAANGGLRVSASQDGQTVEILQNGESVLSYSHLSATDTSGKKLAARMETNAAGDEIGLVVDDAGAQYPIVVDPITATFKQKLDAGPSRQLDARFGFAVAIDGDRAVVGAWREDLTGAPDAGAVYLFARSSGSWTLLRRIGGDGGFGSACGYSVDVQYLPDLGGESRIIYGCPGANGGVGRAFLNLTSGERELLPIQVSPGDTPRHGTSVSFNNRHFMVGAPFYDSNGLTDNGAITLYENINDPNSSTRHRVLDPNPRSNDQFGTSIAENTVSQLVVVGEPGFASNTGAAVVFSYTLQFSDTLNFFQYLQPDNPDPGANFGNSVAIDGRYVVVGAPLDDNERGIDAGAAYVFFSGGGPFTQQQKLLAGNGRVNDHFSEHAVAIQGRLILVGANGHDRTPESGGDVGAAYLFSRSGTAWSQETTFAPNEGFGATDADQFGISVDMSGTTLLIGARHAAATDGTTATGAAYMYDLDCIPPDGARAAIIPAPLFDTDVTVCPGRTETLQASYVYGTPVSIQWRKNGVNIQGANSLSYVLSNITSNDAANYDFVLTNSCGSTISNVATLRVYPYVLSPASGNFSAAGSDGVFSVSSSGGCDYTAVPSNSWITITSNATGTAPKNVAFHVDPNNSAQQRTGSITVGDATFSISQDGLNCSYAIGPLSQNFTSSGGSGEVDIQGTPGCSWTAVSNNSWITITTASSGTGNGFVNYSVAATNGPARTGTMTVAGQSFTVNQSSGCAVTISPVSRNATSAAGTGNVNVTAGAGCDWTATSNSSFLTVISGSSGSGNGVVGYAFTANSDPTPRTGTLGIGGQTFSLMQDAAAAPTPTPTPNLVQFSSSSYSVQEDCTTVTITVNRIGDTSGAASVNYSTSDISATERKDYITALGTLRFAPGETSKSFAILINEDSFIEGNETFNISLTNPSAATLGGPAIATVTITDDATEPSTNPIDDPQNFVCQHYHDFLNRQPDAPGLAFWTNQITSCGSDPNCIETRRINVSASFFLSIEFQDTGYLVERIYKAAYGDALGNSTFPSPHQLPVPIVRLNEFLSDTQEIGQGVIVGQGNWQQQLENNKQAFANAFAQRSRFLTALPLSLTPAQFVDRLNANAGGPLSLAERNQLVNDLSMNVRTRAQVLRAVAEDADLNSAESNRAFVLMQYFGYLRRNPNDPQDTDHTGYDFWLTKLNQFNGNYINAEMVKAFITSIEYRQRFGP